VKIFQKSVTGSYWLIAQSTIDRTGSMTITDTSTEANSKKIHFSPNIAEDESDKDVFKITRANQHEIWETSFMLSCIPILSKSLIHISPDINIRGTKYQRRRFLDNYHKEKLRLIKKCLTDLNDFCNNSLVGRLKFDEKYGQANPSIQKVLREQNCLEYLERVLATAFPDPDILKMARETVLHMQKMTGYTVHHSTRKLRMERKRHAFHEKESEKIREFMVHLVEIGQSVYKLVKSICRDNMENEIYAYTFIYTFEKQAGFNIGAVECIKAILTNNIKLLFQLHNSNPEEQIKGRHDRKFVTDQDIDMALPESNPLKFFVKILKNNEKERHPEILRVLKSVCRMGIKAIAINQELIHRLLLKDEEALNTAVIDTHMDEKLFKFIAPIENGQGEVRVVDQCFDPAGRCIEFPNEMAYLESQLDLFSELCYGRNYLCKRSIEERFPIIGLKENIWNTHLPLDIRASLTRLMLTIYIDAEPRSELKCPDLSRAMEHTEFSKALQWDKDYIFLLENVGEAQDILEERYKDTIMARLRIHPDEITSGDRTETLTSHGSDMELQVIDRSFSKLEVKKSKFRKGGNHYLELQTCKMFLTEFKNQILEYFRQLVMRLYKRNDFTISLHHDYIIEDPGVTDSEPMFHLLCNDGTPFQVYNDLTYEILKLLVKMLNFGLFDIHVCGSQQGEEEIQATNSKKVSKGRKSVLGFIKIGSEPSDNCDMDSSEFQTLIRRLVPLLQSENLIFGKPRAKTTKIETNRGSTNIFQGVAEGFQNLISVEVQNEREDKKQKKKSRKNMQKNKWTQGDDFLANPVIASGISVKKLIQNLPSVISKKFIEESDDEIRIQIQICNLIGRSMDMRQNFLLTNVISYFRNKVKTFDGNIEDLWGSFNDDIKKQVWMPPLRRTGTEVGKNKSGNFQVFSDKER